MLVTEKTFDLPGFPRTYKEYLGLCEQSGLEGPENVIDKKLFEAIMSEMSLAVQGFESDRPEDRDAVESLLKAQSEEDMKKRAFIATHLRDIVEWNSAVEGGDPPMEN